MLEKLGQIKRPVELIEFLERMYGGSWRQLGAEYGRLQGELNTLRESLAAVREKRIEMYKQRNKLKDARREAEAAMGAHFRAAIFEKNPSPEDLAERERLGAALRGIIEAQESLRENVIAAARSQRDMAQNEGVRNAHQSRRNIEIEAELKRATIIREAIMASKGLEKASHRPSAWWFPLLSPDGLWFRETVDSAEAYLEPLC